jgi:predicted DNA-binding protein (UPF0251 family)
LTYLRIGKPLILIFHPNAEADNRFHHISKKMHWLTVARLSDIEELARQNAAQVSGTGENCPFLRGAGITQPQELLR